MRRRYSSRFHNIRFSSSRHDRVFQRRVISRMTITAVAAVALIWPRHVPRMPTRACVRWAATSARFSTRWLDTTAVWGARTRAGCRLFSVRWSTLWTSSGTRVAAHVTVTVSSAAATTASTMGHRVTLRE